MANEYVTAFPATENPLSESGRWTNGAALGVDWNNCRSTPGKVVGTQGGATTFDDSIAVLSGVPSWNAVQVVRATLALTNLVASGDTSFVDEEVELLLRFTLSAHSATGYECTFSVDPNNPYVQVNRWNGAVNSFTQIASVALPQNGSVSSLSNGDKIKAGIAGKHISLYVNDVLVLEVDDATYATGNPGIGFYYTNPTPAHGTYAASDFGFSAVTATNYAWARAGCSLSAVAAATGTSHAFGALSNTPPAGSTIIAAFDTSWTAGAPVITAVTDSAGNAYVKDTLLSVNQGSYTEELSVWRALANGSAITSITATYTSISSGAAGIGIAAYVYGGILNASGRGAALDVNLLVADATSPFQSGTAAGTTDTDFELKLGVYGDAGNNSTLAAGSGFALLIKSDASSVTQMLLEEADAGAANGTASAQSTASADAAAIVGVVVYRVAGGPPRGIKQTDYPKPLLNTYSGRDGGFR